MSYRRVRATGGTGRALAALALALAVVTCRDAVGPHGTGAGQGRVVFAPILPSEAALASFGLAIDQVRIIVVRPAADTLADTTFALPPDSAALDLNLHVALLSDPETLSVSIIALSGAIPLFEGTSDVEVMSGSGTPAPAEIPVDNYVGPGAGVDSIAIQPTAPFIYLNDSLRFQIQAFQGGVPVTQFYIAWSTSDSTIARVNGFGVLRAPATRTTLLVRARTPSGVSDSVTATFVPLPNQLLNVAGGGQIAGAGQPLATQLEVEVRAADNLPVGGVAVRFRALSGGAPADTTVTTGLNGRAKVTGVLGATPGAQSFQATVPAFPAITAVNFGATAVGTISAAMSTISTSTGSVASGGVATLTLQGKDAAGNNITTGGDSVAFSFSGGTSTGAIGLTTDHGNGTYTATFTGAIAGTATNIGATINGTPVTTAQPAITVTSGAIATVTVTPTAQTLNAFAQTQAFAAVARDGGNNVVATSFTWTTDAPGVATVNVSGVAMAIGNGAATIKATATGGVFGTATLTVAQVVASVQVAPALDTLHAVNDSRVFAAVAKDANDSVVSGEAFKWQSSDTTVAVIDSLTGTATAVRNGTATITAKAVSNATTGNATLIVVQNVTSVAVTPATATLSAFGATRVFTAVAKDTNDNVVPGAVFTWSSSDSGVATVNAAGVATATGNGSATITATTSGVSGTANLTVAQVAKQLAFTVQPSTAASGTAIAPAVAVAATDSLGSVVPSFSGDITVAIGANPSSGVLSGTLTQTTALGVATFANLTIDQPGSGYTLVATGTLPPDTSTTFDVAPPAASVSWINPAGGNWSNGANWSGGLVPQLGDTALITLSGTYTVTLDVNDTVGGLKIGGGSGTRTFAIPGSRTLGVGGALQVNAGDVLSLTSATVNGLGTLTNLGTMKVRASTITKPVANLATLLIDGTNSFSGVLTTSAASLIRIQGNGQTGFSHLTVANGFTNNGRIELTDSSGAFGSRLSVTTGALVNAPGGVIEPTPGASGGRDLFAALDNQGTITLSHNLTLALLGADHSNSGTIAVSGGNLTLTQSGTTPSFTTSGTVTIDAGRVFTVNNGGFDYTAGSIGGRGTLAFGNVTATFTPSFSNDTLVLTLTASTVNGPGTLTVTAGDTLKIRGSTIAAPFANLGTLLADGSSAISGAFTTGAGSVLRVQGNGSTGFSQVTVGSGFTNNGRIELTDSSGAFGARLTVTTGTLVNAPSGVIDPTVGAGGTRELLAQIDNQGSVTLSHNLTLASSGADHVNSGTIAVVGGDLTLNQVGVTPSFTTSGTIAIDAGRSVNVSGGAFDYAAGTIGGHGTLKFSAATASFTPAFSNDTLTLVLTSATLNGPGTVTVTAGDTLHARGSTIAAPLVNLGTLLFDGSSNITGTFATGPAAVLRVQGNGSTGFSQVTVASGFTNNGRIELTDSSGAFGARLTVTAGPLLNAPSGVIEPTPGNSGSRELTAALDNQGTVTVSQNLILNASGVDHVNSGTIALIGGNVTLNQTGTTPTFATSGTIAIGVGRTFAVNSGTFDYAAGTIGGRGTLTFTGATANVTPAFSNDTLALILTSSTLNGPGVVTVTAGDTLKARGSTIAAPLVNLGTLLFDGSSNITGTFTTGPAAVLRVQGSGATGFSQVTVATGFTNNGRIELTDSAGAFGSRVTVTTGTLVNAPSGVIEPVPGAGGGRDLLATLDNQGALTVSHNFTISKASAAHLNSGTISITGGKLTFTGGGTTLTNTASGTIAGSDTLDVTAIAFSNAGAMNPGGDSASAVLPVKGNYAQATGGAVNVELGGTTAGTQYDRLAVTGSATLSGGLNVTTINSFAPALGDTFTVMTFASRSGLLTGLTLPTLGGGLALDTIFTPTSLRLFVKVPLTVHSADITADETWAAAQGTHIVSGYLRILNGATVTIEPGVLVKFDAAAGLQLGDTALGESGGLIMQGTTGAGIALTANTATPTPGFWRGIEVQRRVNNPFWRNVLIEYAGGARPNPFNEACLLVVNGSGAPLAVDSLHFRQCVHAAIHHFGGALTVRNTQIDSVTGSGIHVDFTGELELDSTTIRGSGQEGLFIGSSASRLVNSEGNSFFDNALGSIHLFAHQLPGLFRQTAISGNGLGGVGDTIVVDGGRADTSVTAFTILRQPAPYLVTGVLRVGRVGGVGVTLDRGLEMAFDATGGLVIGEGTFTAQVTSLGTLDSQVVLRNRPGPAGWLGMSVGTLSGPSLLKHVRLIKGAYIPCCAQIQGENLMTNLFVDMSSGTGSLAIDSVVSDSSFNYGVLIMRGPQAGFRMLGGAVTNSGSTGLVVRTPYNPSDSITGVSLTGNRYPAQMLFDNLPSFGLNAVTGNQRDTLLLRGGTLIAPDTLPEYGSVPWRVQKPLLVDDGALLWILAGDTVFFDDSVSLQIGGSAPSAIRALGTALAPILLTSTPGHPRWFGVEFANLDGIANLSNSTVRNVIFERAGRSIPCFGDCSPTPVAGVRYSNVSPNALTLDSVTIRQAVTIALDVDSAAASPVTVLSSQFYQNAASPMIRSRNPLNLVIHGSDLYHYRAQIIQSANAGPDSVDAQNNWWGDVEALERGFEFSDSLGRGSLWFNSVNFAGFDLAPNFPVGPAVTLVAARDTFLFAGDTVLSVVGQSDSLRVRALDAEGRGTGGFPIGWTTTSGAVTPPAGATDMGGRSGVEWLTGSVSGLHSATATGPGTVVFGYDLRPASTQPGTVNWQLDDVFTQGTVLDPRTVTFTSTNRPARIITHARDQFGNATQPNELGFADVAGGLVFPQYGVTDSLKGDTIYFHTVTNLPPTFVLRGLYDFGLNGVDSVLIHQNPVAAGIRIDREVQFSPGIIDSLPNPVPFFALCRNGNPAGGFCEKEFHAFVVDAGGGPIGNGLASFRWRTPAFPDTAITITLQRGTPANDTVFVQAHENGMTWLIAADSAPGSPTFGMQDSVPVFVLQAAVQVIVTPDTVSKLIGEQATFSGYVADFGGDTVRAVPVHWRVDAPYAGTLTILDTLTTPGHAVVRLEGVINGEAVLTAFASQTGIDSLFGIGRVKNPVITPLVAGDPDNLAVDHVVKQAYVTDNERSQVHIFDVSGESEVGAVGYGEPAGGVGIAANPTTGQVFVSLTSRNLLQINGPARSLARTLDIGLDQSFVALDTTSRNRAFIVAEDRGLYWLYVLRTDDLGKTDSLQVTSRGQGIAYNQAMDVVYVVHNQEDSLGVYDVRQGGPPTLIVKVPLGRDGYDVAVNHVKGHVYVTEASAEGWVKLINAADNKLLDSVSVGFSVYPQGLDVDPIADRVYVSRSQFGNIAPGVTILDGGLGFVNASGIVGSGVYDVGVDPVGGRVYAVDRGSRDLLILKFTP